MNNEAQKAIGQFKLQLNGVLSPFNQYGLSVYISPAIKEIVDLALQLHKRLSGEDIPIAVNSKITE